MGAQFCSSTIEPKKQKRESSQTSFLKEAKNRSNLKVYSFTMVRKILFDDNKRATGVVVKTTGMRKYTLKANKEIILSAGAFQSPQILMVSGIGPPGSAG